MENDLLTEVKHPLQPLRLDGSGELKFKPNKLLELLVGKYHISLTEMMGEDVPDEDKEQFLQLLGLDVDKVRGYDVVNQLNMDIAEQVYLQGTTVIMAENKLLIDAAKRKDKALEVLINNMKNTLITK